MFILQLHFIYETCNHIPRQCNYNSHSKEKILSNVNILCNKYTEQMYGKRLQKFIKIWPHSYHSYALQRCRTGSK